MELRSLFALLPVLIQYLFHPAVPFNLEPRIPLVKRGNPGSYFGYSVAEHQAVDDITQNVQSSWLLVGAPLDQNLQPETNQSGALWRCPITTLADDCVQVVTDGKRTIDSSELMPPLDDEVKNGQWLGVTVRSQGTGGKVMVCAHRYVRKGKDYQWGQGMCYTLTQYLDYDETWEPCKGRPVNKAHEQYGYCQAGTSGVLLNDTAVIGTPGPYTWRGTVYVISVSEDYLNRDKTLYFGPLTDTDYPVDKYSYLGMSVTAGKFLGNTLSYAAGAPRSNGTGQVIIFVHQPPTNPMKVELILNGEQFASSFGYEITNADVNGDKLPDLIVGAPFYFSQDGRGGAVYIYMNNLEHCLNCNKPVKLTGKLESRFGFSIASLGDLNKDGFDDIAIGAPYEDEGVVYIYLGSSNGILATPSQILRAADFPQYNRPEKTFGYSLSGGIDLDQNGYPDLLVGAYEQDSVVLVRSRPIIGIITTIEPDVKHRKIDPSKQGCATDPFSAYTCFSFETCCVVESRVKSLKRGSQNLTVSYSIEAEVFPGSPKKYSRVWFGEIGGEAPFVVRKTIVLEPDPRHDYQLGHCETETVYISRNASDIQSPIDFRLTYSLVQREPRQVSAGQPLPPIDDYPILNQQEATKIFRFMFQTDCGDNDVCESELHVEANLLLPAGRRPSSWELLLGEQKEVRLNVTVQNFNESAYDAWLYVVFPPSLTYISHLAEMKHIPCDRFNTTLVACKLGNPFKKDNVANVILRFDPTGIKDIEPDLQFVVFANSTSEERRPQGPLAVQADVIRRAEVSIAANVYPDHVFYGGEVKGESVMEYRSDVGSRVLHSYVVHNKGPWRISSLTVAVEWPFQVANNKPQGKWLLYLDELPTVEAVGGGECLLAEDQVNPLGLPQRPGLAEVPLEALTLPAEPPAAAVDASNHTRTRRDTEMIIRAEAYTGKDGRKHEVVRMDCLLGTAKCLKFNCTVFNLNKNREATIKIRARLWNSTLVEDYPKVDSINISSRAKIHLPKHLGIQQDTSNDETQAVTIAYPDRIDQQEAEPVPVWIIVVAIVAGLLLLILLTLVLWKLGFFKRRRPDPTLSGNLEKHRDENGEF